MTGSHATRRNDTDHLLGTQSLVHTLGYCWNRPILTVLEVAWRWLFGVPALWLIYYESLRIAGRVDLTSTGILRFNLADPLSDPGQAAAVLSHTVALLMPAVRATATWLAPAMAIGWAIFSGIGRNVVMRRYDRSVQWKPVSVVALQVVRIFGLLCVFALWYRSIEWAARVALSGGGEPNLLSYFAWVICISLGVFSGWSLFSWVLFIAPLLAMLEGSGPLKALLQSLRLGRPFTGKLIEVNLVMSIVKLMLIVLAVVFSATPLPFQTQLTYEFLHWWWFAITLLYFIASDFFQVARLVSFVEFWKVFRAQG